MFTCCQLHNEALVEISIKPEVGAVHGAKISFSRDGLIYHPCAIMRGRDANSLLECCFWEWNEAVENGNLKFNGAPRPVYWNLYLNGMHDENGTVYLRVEVLLEGSMAVHEARINLQPSTAVFLDDWDDAAHASTGWTIEEGSLTVEPGGEVAPLRVFPGLSGRYDVIVGIRYGTLQAQLMVSDEGIRYPFFVERSHPELQDKAHKEIRWKTVTLRPESALEISPTPMTLRDPKTSPFGSMRYLKLAPAREAGTPPQAAGSNTALALYFEPYSWAFCYDLHERWRVREALMLFQEMGATEIHNQIIRFGSRSLHYGQIAQRHDEGALMGDDGTFSPGPTAMVQSLDVLRESIDLCRELGLTHYANAGLTNCYPGTALEDAICRNHPEWREGAVLRYSHPETRAYAAGIAGEFAAWGSDGISIDCMRYPYRHTEEDLLALFHEIRQATASPRRVPITARIPAGDVTYFRAFEQLAREGVVECVIPSSLFMREPRFSLKPYLKWRDYGCRVYGIIDGWLGHVGAFGNFQFSINRTPRDIREDITRFLEEGADGIFVYQADNHCADSFNRMAFYAAMRGQHAGAG